MRDETNGAPSNARSSVPAPRRAPAGDGGPPMPAPNPENETRGRVLFMDDEEAIRDVMGLMLRRRGFDVTVVGDGREAVAAYGDAIARSLPYDAVVLDLVVPGGVRGAGGDRGPAPARPRRARSGLERPCAGPGHGRPGGPRVRGGRPQALRHRRAGGRARAGDAAEPPPARGLAWLLWTAGEYSLLRPPMSSDPPPLILAPRRRAPRAGGLGSHARGRRRRCERSRPGRGRPPVRRRRRPARDQQRVQPPPGRYGHGPADGRDVQLLGQRLPERRLRADRGRPGRDAARRGQRPQPVEADQRDPVRRPPPRLHHHGQRRRCSSR